MEKTKTKNQADDEADTGFECGFDINLRRWSILTEILVAVFVISGTVFA